MNLYSHWRSSASYRLRIALHLKRVAFKQITVDLTPAQSAQHRPEFKTINPQGLVPSLVLDNGCVLTQSIATIEYLDELIAMPPLLPGDAAARARIRAMAQMVTSDMHPLHTTRVFEYMANTLRLDQLALDRWTSHWVTRSLAAIEVMIGDTGYCFDNAVTLADVVLVPEVYAARRFKVDLTPFPRVRRVDERCCALEAFALAHPSRQPDAPSAL
jgi:maleylacetoacetate isomerase